MCARAVIAATGAFERPMVFPDNDRPGIMLAGAGEKFAEIYGVAAGTRAVLAANSTPYGVTCGLPNSAMPTGTSSPESEISAAFTVTPAVVYSPIVSVYPFATNRSEPDTVTP